MAVLHVKPRPVALLAGQKGCVSVHESVRAARGVPETAVRGVEYTFLGVIRGFGGFYARDIAHFERRQSWGSQFTKSSSKPGCRWTKSGEIVRSGGHFLLPGARGSTV